MVKLLLNYLFSKYEMLILYFIGSEIIATLVFLTIQSALVSMLGNQLPLTLAAGSDITAVPECQWMLNCTPLSGQLTVLTNVLMSDVESLHSSLTVVQTF